MSEEERQRWEDTFFLAGWHAFNSKKERNPPYKVEEQRDLWFAGYDASKSVEFYRQERWT